MMMDFVPWKVFLSLEFYPVGVTCCLFLLVDAIDLVVCHGQCQRRSFRQNYVETKMCAIVRDTIIFLLNDPV